MMRGLCLVLCATLVAAASPAALRQDPPASEADVRQAIDRLGSFDFETRTAAGRTVRRAPAAMTAALLTAAVRAHKDEYVRFRALVLLAGLGDTRTAALMREALADRNDRLRTVAGHWFEHYPEPAIVPALIAALQDEASEFVRPALTRALAAHGADARAQEALVPLVRQGQDFFRGAVIEALGDHKGSFASAAIMEVAELDGPLQDDAITALAKLGVAEFIPRLGALQKTAGPELQPTIAAAFCLLGQDCVARKRFVRDTLAFAIANETQQPVLRGAVHALGVLAAAGGHDDALTALVASGAGAAESARAPVALAVGLVALRNPAALLRVLGSTGDPGPTVELVRDAFDMLSEDFEEERFYVFVRRAYWAAPAGSAERRVAELLIVRLEF
jgi:hypothetical protein